MQKVNKNRLNSGLDFSIQVKNGLTILLYHGVTEKKYNKGLRNRQGKHIYINNFIEQMDYVNNFCNPITLDDWLSYRTSGELLPNNSVIISFDDGFRNNFTVAAPILADRKIPAIFYVSSGVISTNIMFWVDILEDCLHLCKQSSIQITLDKTIEFKTETDDDKFITLMTIKKWCKLASNIEKNRVLTEVSNKTCVKPSVDHYSDYEKISWTELVEMHQNHLFTIGGHSLYHNILTSLEDDLLEKEIRTSLDLLEINLNTQIKHYSYPEGQSNHYSDRVIALLKEAGIICCPTAIHGINDASEDPFHLKRVMVGFDDIPFPYLEVNA